ncbi:MAG: hypothetical protein M3R36_13945 [Bacteroidota bacterium]|nr:hypothetical protein [Bacteroidota bacterium]
MKDIKMQLICIILLFLTVNLISYLTQDRINVNGGKDVEGMHYFETSEKFSKDIEVTGSAPYIYRLGTPYLVSLLDKNNILQSFFIINLTANFISCLLLFWFLKLSIKSFAVIFTIVALYLTHWFCNTRFIYYSSVIPDPCGLVFFLLGLILLQRLKRNESGMDIFLLTVTSFTGVLFSEIMILIPTALIFIKNPVNRKHPFFINPGKLYKFGLIFIPLLACISGFVLVHIILMNNFPDFSYLMSTAKLFYKKTLLNYLRSVFIVFGPVIVLLLFFYRQVINYLKENQHILIISISFCVMSFVGGNTERILLWFFPVMLLLLGLIIEKNLSLIERTPILLTLILSQSISNRIFLTTGQPIENLKDFSFPVLTQIENGGFFNLTTQYTNKLFGLLSLIEYLIVVGILFMMLRYFSLKKKNFNL